MAARELLLRLGAREAELVAEEMWRAVGCEWVCKEVQKTLKNGHGKHKKEQVQNFEAIGFRWFWQLESDDALVQQRWRTMGGTPQPESQLLTMRWVMQDLLPNNIDWVIIDECRLLIDNAGGHNCSRPRARMAQARCCSGVVALVGSRRG